jgi:hypothetical protein
MKFIRRLALLLATVFVFSVLTVEPECVQGYQGDNFPVFVESDSLFAICSNDFAIPIRCFLATEIIPLPIHPRPASTHAVSDNPSRGPPVISFIL